MEPRIQYCTTSDGVSIAYARSGEGPAVVILPNLWANIQFFYELAPEPLIHNAANGRQTVVFDGRGSGASQRDVPGVSLETRLIDLSAVLDHLALESAILMGISHGGPAAIAYAARNPGRVSHLILATTYANGAEYYARAPVMRAFLALEEMVVDQWDFYTLTAANAVLGYRSPEMGTRLAAMYRDSITPEMLLMYRDGSRATDVSALLPKVVCPTLVLDDRSSPLRVEAHSREIASKIPASRLVSFEGAGMTGGDVTGGAIVEFLSTGAVSEMTMRAAPSAFRTVLFTDLVGHTEMMQRLGDVRGRDVLREHERITRETLRHNGGAEVKSMGDGFMASFASVTSAIDCAIELQRAFETPSDAIPEGLHVRVGIDAGEPIEEDGDLFGSMVIMASRVCAEADAGEILIPEPVRHLLAGKGFAFSPRGEFVPRGFDEAVRLYEVNWRN